MTSQSPIRDGFCPYNVKVDFDYQKFSWVRNNGSEITDFAWWDEKFPAYKDVLTYNYAADLSRPVSWASKFNS